LYLCCIILIEGIFSVASVEGDYCVDAKSARYHVYHVLSDAKEY